MQAIANVQYASAGMNLRKMLVMDQHKDTTPGNLHLDQESLGLAKRPLVMGESISRNQSCDIGECVTQRGKKYKPIDGLMESR